MDCPPNRPKHTPITEARLVISLSQVLQLGKTTDLKLENSVCRCNNRKNLFRLKHLKLLINRSWIKLFSVINCRHSPAGSTGYPNSGHARQSGGDSGRTAPRPQPYPLYQGPGPSTAQTQVLHSLCLCWIAVFLSTFILHYYMYCPLHIASFNFFSFCFYVVGEFILSINRNN